MSKNRLTIAFVLLVGLGVLTLVMVKARRADYAPVTQTQVTLPKLAEDKIDELEISGPDQPKTRLVKKGDEWRVAEPVDAKADEEAVKAAVKRLTELKINGTAATKKENHDRLEVTADKATHVVAKSGGKPVLDAYIGSYDSGSTMLRLEGQDLVATVEGSVRYAFRKQPKDFRDRVISKLETANVTAILFDSKNGHFEFERDGDDWKQVVPKGQKRIEPLDVPKVRGIVGSATSLSASDFAAPQVTIDQAGLDENAGVCTLKLKPTEGSPSEVRFRIGRQKDSNYYLLREGVDTIYLVSNWLGARLQPSAEEFIKKDPPKAAAAPTPPPVPGQQGMNSQQVMEEIQRQLNAQGR